MAVTFSKVLMKVFGSRNERLLKRYQRVVAQVNALEPDIRAKTDVELRERTQELRRLLTTGKLRSLEVMPEAFAIIREAMDRNIGIRAIFDPDNHFDPDKLSDDMLEAYDEVQRALISSGQSWRTVPIPPKIYDAIRALYPESRPPFRARCFDVQLIGGLVLYEGKIAEMATGEGKTFVGPLACFMRVLEGNHAHVVTVNDYLVRRDATWIRPAFENLGLSVGFIQSEMEPGGDARRVAYGCDVTYGTNAEFGFDFLRDNMKDRVALQVQGPLEYVIVDEVDSILIDEARTPLIISGAAHDDAAKYRAADVVARKVIEMNKPWDAAEAAVDAAKRLIKSTEGDEDRAKGKSDKAGVEDARQRRRTAEQTLADAEARRDSLTQFYEVELDRKSVHLTHEGIAAAQDAAGVGSFFVGNNMEWPHLMDQSMRAHVVYERDKDYVVERGQKGQMEVVIVDEYTGRKMAGRQWSDGLHQAVEAKERVPIKEETQTLATITLQNFFKMYRALSGMTGTAMTEAEEFAKIYKLDVVNIPTNRPIKRQDNEDRVYRTEREKWEAIIDEIKEISGAGRPVLVGTTSVEKSETLSEKLMRKYGIQHEVLNAKQHEREAQIVAMAGLQHKNQHDEMVGNVTIATNMAGRGTDIKLNVETTTAGGLHVIGTERHTARRIDNQLRGRSGRQGDPGSSRFYVSLQDELMKLFAGDWTIKVLGWLGMEEGMAIEDKRISKGILRAQKKVEERNFLARKNLLEYDEVMDHQRTTFYGMRQQVLKGQNVDVVIWGMIGEAITDAVDKYITQDFVAATVAEWARVNFEVTLEPADLHGMRSIEELENYIKNHSRAEAETNITATMGEFIGEDSEDRSTWDTKGLQAWAMSRFHVNLSQTQMRQMNADELEIKLRQAAVEQIDERSCAGLMKYLEHNYAEQELANWAREKFAIEMNPKDFILDERSHAVRPSEEIIQLIDDRAREAYSRREIEYPVEHALTFAYGGPEGFTDNPYAAEYIRDRAQEKYRVEMSIDKIRGGSLSALREELLSYQRAFMTGGKLEETVHGLIEANKDTESLRKAVNERFSLKLTARDFQIKDEAAQKEGRLVTKPASPEQIEEKVMELARYFFRRELTDLEQYVVIQILDQSWKDHLYAMDMLKAGIGLIAFAEQDPRVQFKKEGYRYFLEMMAGVRDKVTDLIFRARVVGVTESKSAYKETAAVHAESGGYGVAESLAATGAAAGGALPAPAASETQQAAGRRQGEAAKVKPIVREAVKVGRNDLCPCGSGKKYKKCHGVGVA
ncbi:MAG: SEC-C metal-binding domain-containing protein [Planctomycetota bacterium]|nr:SEC-C metal-binding domain-containing protein [Planctomycetota bacterium]